MATATGSKTCVKCGKDVTNDKRMKDAQGKYWCLDCGAADSKNKKQRGVCADCRGKYPPESLQTTPDGDAVCSGCLAARSKPGYTARAAGSEADDEARKRKFKIIAAVVLLILGGGLITLSFLEII